MSEISSIIERLQRQRESIDKAIAALNEVESVSNSSTKAGSKKRGMSAAGRQRISEATKKRWADKRAAESERPTKKRILSVSARRRISEAQRKRWAAMKSQAETPKKAATKTKAVKKAAKKTPRKRKAAQPVQGKTVGATATE